MNEGSFDVASVEECMWQMVAEQDRLDVYDRKGSRRQIRTG